MKHFCILLFFFLFNKVYGNMASPVRGGTFSSLPYSSKNVDVLKETILIRLNKDFKSADFNVRYEISCEKSGKQIPLLFLAQDYKMNFEIWVDGKSVSWKEIPEEYTLYSNHSLDEFNSSFDTTFKRKQVRFSFGDYMRLIFRLNELKYFELDLAAGKHEIRVKYRASYFIDRRDWVQEYSYRYSLFPAKKWKSFGSLHVKILDESGVNYFSTNLGKPQKIGKEQNWSFSSLPFDYINITYQPRVSSFANILIQIGVWPLVMTVFIFLVIIHIWLIKSRRRKHPQVIFNFWTVLGGFLVPILTVSSILWVHDFINWNIGSHASEYSGDFYFVLGTPVYILIYLPVVYIIENLVHLRKQN